MGNSHSNHHSHSLSRSDFITVRHLSAERDGGFNQGVVLVRHRRNNKLYIEKRVSLRAIRSGHAAREARAMAMCRHPHIIQAYFADLNTHFRDYGSIYMTHCELGSLDEMIDRFGRKGVSLPEGFLWKVLWDMSTALCYLQTGQKSSRAAREGRPIDQRREGWDKILHRDIKPANIFLTRRHQETQYPTVVLGDFGSSLMASDRQSPLMTAWTRPFAAPEEPRYSDTSDVYSLALSVHCLATLRATPASRTRVNLHPATGYGRTLNDLLSRLLKTSAHDRPKVAYLPYLVFREMMEAKREREMRGLTSETLPSWAFGQ